MIEVITHHVGVPTRSDIECALDNRIGVNCYKYKTYRDNNGVTSSALENGYTEIQHGIIKQYKGDLQHLIDLIEPMTAVTIKIMDFAEQVSATVEFDYKKLHSYGVNLDEKYFLDYEWHFDNDGNRTRVAMAKGDYNTLLEMLDDIKAKLTNFGHMF